MKTVTVLLNYQMGQSLDSIYNGEELKSCHPADDISRFLDNEYEFKTAVDWHNAFWISSM